MNSETLKFTLDTIEIAIRIATLASPVTETISFMKRIAIPHYIGYLLFVGTNHTKYATEAPTILNIPDHTHLFSVCRMSSNPTKTPAISHRAVE